MAEFYRDFQWWEPVRQAFYYTFALRVQEEIDREYQTGWTQSYYFSRIMDLGAEILTAELDEEWQDDWIDWLSVTIEFDYEDRV